MSVYQEINKILMHQIDVYNVKVKLYHVAYTFAKQFYFNSVNSIDVMIKCKYLRRLLHCVML